RAVPDREVRRQVGTLAAKARGALMRTALIYSDEWRRFDYGPEHPLRMERLGLTWRLMEHYGLTALPTAKVMTPAPASADAIRQFHDAEYVDVLRAVSAGD